MVGEIEFKATQPSWGLGLAELGNIIIRLVTITWGMSKKVKF